MTDKIWPRPGDRQIVYLKWDEAKIHQRIPAIQAGDIAALERSV